MHEPPSVLMCVGKTFYNLSDLIEEAETLGLSKRIPLTSIPQGLVPYSSKIFVAHPDAIIEVTAEGKTLFGLACILLDTSHFTWYDATDAEPDWMLDLALALDKSSQKFKLIEEFGIVFHMGIVGYSYIQDIVYIAKKDEEDLPDNLKMYDGYVHPVRVERIEEDEE